MSEVVIVFGGMAAGPNTLDIKSLGGSETAAICMAKELRLQGHMVTVFCNSEWEGIDDIGVRWSPISQYQGFITTSEVDIIIASRDPNFLSFPNQSKKNVLWCHDLATYATMGPLMSFAWNIDEIWTVSEFHRQQLHKIIGYPLSHIWATRNGIFDVGKLMDIPRSKNELLFAARPERGLINLVRPGGIMSRLPEYTLKVAMYDNWPPHMTDYYNHVFTMAKALPNVEIVGAKTQKQLRQMMRTAAAYVYPTIFEEVSCIIAREAMSEGLPIIYTPIGALPETIQDCGHSVLWGKEDIGSDAFCEHFAASVRRVTTDETYSAAIARRCLKRKDLGWGPVALDWEERFVARRPSPYSGAKSLIMDGDVFAAKAVADKYGVSYWQDHIKKYYPFITGDKTISEHYKGIYELEEAKGVPERRGMRTLKGSARYEEIKRLLSSDQHVLNSVLEYGCAEGPIILQLAIDFPNKRFVGIDIVETNVELCKKYAAEANITNVEFHLGETENWPEAVSEKFDAAIIAEVLEHTLKPWEVSDRVEAQVRPGGMMIISVPHGPWEWDGLVNNPSQWAWRAHIWHITKDMLRIMYDTKSAQQMSFLPHAKSRDGRIVGNIVMMYFADQKPAKLVDPLMKAKMARFRQSVGFAIIAMDAEAYIVRCLQSIVDHASQIRIALGPSKDKTRLLAEEYMSRYPHIDFAIVDVPKIEVDKFGFDDARNASVMGLETDWVFWIDTDEYLSGGDLASYLKDNAFDSYAVHQHHFTVEPRGAPTQLDKPARVYRNNGKFTFFGKVHEHAEVGFNGGPGFTMLLNSIDIGHTGYVNEGVRRDRFARNWPLLVWDRKCYPDRKIGKFLWFRDLFHQMAWMMEQKRVDEGMAIAKQAVDFFRANKDEFLFIGSGPQNSLHYYSQANRVLNQGHEVKVRIELEGMVAEYQGVFTSSTEATEIAEKAIREQIEKRSGGYWQ
jgi:2-polyprenyl-3-methyl-5-hydroxy-6-metoxy-1,4-benzoquinol methylase/glycosyltransferase involved in cell wall biosynthesis